MTSYCIISLKHTKPSDKYLVLWMSDNKGYCYSADSAGIYHAEEVQENLTYYNHGPDIAVNAEALKRLAMPISQGDAYYGPGPCVPNCKQAWDFILENLIAEPIHKPQPKFWSGK